MHSWILYFLSSMVVAYKYNKINVDFVATIVCRSKNQDREYGIFKFGD
jgi:hypothetical protein